MRHFTLWYKFTDVSEVPAASIIVVAVSFHDGGGSRSL
jgi:hypothetical protein